MPGRERQEGPHTLYARFVRDCVTVARFGTDETRRDFLRQYEEVLGGVGVQLRNLPGTHQEQLFLDAARLREGGIPRTPAGLRLAMPRWFTRRIDHPVDVWAEAAGFRPKGPALSRSGSVCVDKETTQSPGLGDQMCDMGVESAKAA